MNRGTLLETFTEMKNQKPAPAANAPELLRIGEAAALLRCSVRTIRARVADGTLAAYRMENGQTLLFRRADLLALLTPVYPPEKLII